MNDYILNLGYIYPDILNSETGSLDVFKYRLEKRGIELNINKINYGSEISENDIYFFTGGSDKSVDNACAELNKYKTFFEKEAEEGKVILGFDSGFTILTGHREYKNGKKVEGLGLIRAYSKQEDKRFTGNVIADLNIAEQYGFTKDKLLGFENHGWHIFLGKETKPLAKVIQGKGNNGKDKTEGAIYKNVVGTWLRGPVMANNPDFADFILKLAIEKKYGKEVKLNELNDTEEKAVYTELLTKKY